MDISYLNISTDDAEYLKLYGLTAMKNHISYLLQFMVNNNLTQENRYIELWEKFIVTDKQLKQQSNYFTKLFLEKYMEQHQYTYWAIDFKEGAIDFK